MLSTVKQEFEPVPDFTFVRLHMNHNQLRYTVLIIAGALAGLVGIQIYWINNAISLEQDRIKRGASEALNEVVDLIERHEAVTKIRSHQEAKYLFVHGDSSEPMFPPDDSLIEYVVKRNIQRVGDKVELSVEQEHAGHTEEKTIIYTVPDVPYTLDLEDRPQLRMTTADSIELEIYNSAEALNRDVSQLKDRLKSKRTYLGDIVKSLIEVNLNQPIDERVDPRVVDSLLQLCLNKHGLNLDYEMGIFDQSRNMVFGDESHELALNRSDVCARLFPNDVIQVPYFLRVYFPNEGGYIFNNIWLMLLISLVLIAALVWSSYYSVRTIFVQKQNNQIKNDFINNMTHELKTPISTISLACEALNDPELAKIPQVQSRYLGIINTENKRLGVLVEEVLQSAVLDKGDFKLKREDLDFHVLLSDVIDKYQIQLADRKTVLEVNLNAENSILEGDKNHLANVIYNLLDNAVKYTRGEPHITISTRNVADRIELAVQDRGIGISAENQKKIFDRLYRVPTGNIHNVKGFGLGLSYVKIITERHGGRVSVVSQLEKGSTFYVEIPLKTIDHEQGNEK